MEYKYKIGVIKSDMGGCFQLRILQPFSELRRHGIDYAHKAFLPVSPFEDPENLLVKWIEQFDLIILQRCFKYDIFERLRRACDIAGRKLVFETDDDYINLPAYNPCYVELNRPGIMDGFKEILRQSDYITVTTQELKDVYYLYNKNIKVFPNNVEHVDLFKDLYMEALAEGGRVPHHECFGFYQYPTWVSFDAGKGMEIQKLFKVGYTGTPTHRQDYLTIKPHLEKFLEKFPNTIMFYIGDPWFVQEGHPANHKNVVFIPNSPYELYLQNIRLFDVGIAPLVPDIFNMGKSSLKLLEYGSWGIPAVAPDYITYNRHFTHGENAMLYKNGKEFYDMMCEMAQNQELRGRLGFNAAEMIQTTRTERVNSQERYDFYESIIEGSKKFLRFRPNKEKQLETTT